MQSVPTGSAVLGTAGAVVDLDKPIALFATNTSTGNVYPGTASPTDGSFTIPVQGKAGDAITLKATDANPYPLNSPVIPVGTIDKDTPIPTQIPKSDWTNDPNFLPRTLSRDGAYLAVASLPTSNGSSDKLVILGIADPAHPNLIRTVPTAAGAIRDVVVQNGWAYVAADRFFTLDLTNPNATPVLTGDPYGSDYSVALAGGYAFTAEVNYNNDGRINIYDVSNPAAPRYIRQQAVSGLYPYAFTDLLTFGTDYLIGISNWRPGNVGHDVMVMDRRDLSSFKKVADLDIPNFDAFRGTIIGTNLYLVSQNQAQTVVVDLSNPALPRVTGTVNIPAIAGGIGVVGRDGFVAAAGAGLVTLDVTNPAAPTLTGTTAVGGTAFDVSLVGAYAYVANELGIALVAAQIAPQIALSRISMSLSGTTVTITGLSQSVTGNTPITIDLTNTTNGAMIAGMAIQSDGSFSATLSGRPADGMTIKASDAFGRITGPLSLGTVPFGSTTHSVVITQAQSDANFFARLVATSGNWLAVASYPTDNGSSDKILLYDITDRANPVYRRTVLSNSGAIRDLAIVNGWLILAADRVATLNLSDPNSAPILFGDPYGSDYAMTVVDGFAFTAEVGYNNDGRINVYDVSSPATPRYLRQQAVVGLYPYAFTGLAPLGSSYLVGVSTWKPGNVGHDLIVLDRRDLASFKKVSELEIPNFDAFRITIVGTRAYVSGVAGGLAVVDLSVPASPSLIGIVHTPGYPFLTNALGSMLAVADGSAGATFVDMSPAGLPTILGNQPTGGNAFSCAFNAATLYIANETGISIIDNLGTAPLIDRSLITISNTSGGTTATVTGAAKAILGFAPIKIEVKNVSSGASISGLQVAADGSFNVVITAAAGDVISVKATDGVDRLSGPFIIGTVPFGARSTYLTITPAITDATFFARVVATSGNWLAVGSYPTDNGASDKIVLYDVTIAATRSTSELCSPTPDRSAIWRSSTTGSFSPATVWPHSICPIRIRRPFSSAIHTAPTTR